MGGTGTEIDSLRIPANQSSGAASWNEVRAAMGSNRAATRDAAPEKASKPAQRGRQSKKKRQKEVKLANAELTVLLDAIKRGEAVPAIPGEHGAFELAGHGDILGGGEDWILGESRVFAGTGRMSLPAAPANAQRGDDACAAQGEPNCTVAVARLERDMARVREAYAAAVARAERSRAEAVEALLEGALEQLRGKTANEPPPTRSEVLSGAEVAAISGAGGAAMQSIVQRGEGRETRRGPTVPSTAADAALLAARAALAGLKQARHSTTPVTTAERSSSGSGISSISSVSSSSSSAAGGTSLEERMRALQEANVLLSGADYARQMMEAHE